MSAAVNDADVDNLIAAAFTSMATHLSGKETITVSRWSELVSRMRWALIEQRKRIEDLEAAAKSERDLRDWFAGQALTHLADANVDGKPPEVARYCYHIADAMLAARDQS